MTDDALEEALEQWSQYKDAYEDRGQRIKELESEIDHLEKNFTEWLKQYRAQTDRIAALEAENAKLKAKLMAAVGEICDKAERAAMEGKDD